MIAEKINNLAKIDTTKLLIRITGCIESSKNIREFINEARTILQSSGFPIFNLSLMINENGKEFLLVNADLFKLNLKSSMISDDESSELNIIRKIQLAEDCQYNENMISPLMQGIIIKTKGIKISDENLQTCNIDKSRIVNNYFSLSTILSKLNNNLENDKEHVEGLPGEIVIYPVISDNKFIGTIDFFFPGDKVLLTHDETRLLAVISRIIGYSYRNFLNIHRVSTSESKYRAIFESTPLAILVVNRDYQVIESNSRFKAWYPKYTENGMHVCFKNFPIKEKDTPCNDCLVKLTFETGNRETREIKSRKESKTVYYEIKTSPVISESGEITAVMKTIEDITDRVLAENQIKRKNKKLETAVTRQIEILKNNEKNLKSLVNSVRSLGDAKSRKECIEKIISGYINLKSKGVILALYNENEITFERFFPDDKFEIIKRILDVDIKNMRISANKNPENPFVLSSETSNPIFFIGEDGMTDFFKSLFPRQSKKTIKRAVDIFNGMSLVVLPLETSGIVKGAIAVVLELDILENNFEYFQLLSNSAAGEIGRQENSEMLEHSQFKFRELAESTSDMVSLCDKHGNIKYLNKNFIRKTGCDENKYGNLSIYDFFSSQYKLLLNEAIEKSIVGRNRVNPVELLIGNQGKDICWTELTIDNVSNGSSEFQLVFKDTSDEKNMKEEIELLTSFKDKIIHNDFIGIITINLEGRIQSWNRGAANILGYEEDEMINRNIADLIISGYDVKLINSPGIQNAINQTSSEIILKKKNGDRATVMYIESEMKDSSNKPMKVIAYFFDISEKIKLQAKSIDLIKQLNQAQQITILSLAKLTEFRDIETGAHLEKIMKYTNLLAKELSKFDDYKGYISDEYITDLVNSSPLHDIGKVGIPDSILHKPGKLSANEFDVMKNHSVIGGDTITDAEQRIEGRSYLKLGKEVAYYHHERWDGKGYPKGLKGNQIPLSARIIAIADVYDALRSKRPYKESFTHEKTLRLINNSANSHFDETVVKAFLNCQDDFKTVSDLKLAN